jgi:hypothetical protein
MNTRINPAAGLAELEDLSDFRPRAAPHRSVSPEVIDRIAEQEGFPSRTAQGASSATQLTTTSSRGLEVTSSAHTLQQPSINRGSAHAPRRYTTGRNQQINIKATSETISRLQNLAVAAGVPQGELLRRALDAYEREKDK